tara:strand:+ start:141 stop:335 length:195 start_codon:yes stop_codon:yes gene_type:complete
MLAQETFLGHAHSSIFNTNNSLVRVNIWDTSLALATIHATTISLDTTTLLDHHKVTATSLATGG